MAHDLGESVQRNNFCHPVAKAMAQVMGTDISDLCLYSIFRHQVSQRPSRERALINGCLAVLFSLITIMLPRPSLPLTLDKLLRVSQTARYLWRALVKKIRCIVPMVGYVVYA